MKKQKAGHSFLRPFSDTEDEALLPRQPVKATALRHSDTVDFGVNVPRVEASDTRGEAVQRELRELRE